MPPSAEKMRAHKIYKPLVKGRPEVFILTWGRNGCIFKVMRLSKLFTKTLREAPKDEASVNAQFLERAGFIYKNSAGVYTFLPLGWRVIQKIANIIREEMNSIGADEMFMPALHDKRYLTATGRWDVDVLFKVVTGKEKEPSFNISWTHEEIAAEIASKNVSSYQDLPFSFYQIQTKFRNEPRAKSGLLRGREFLMKDLYSFHADEKDMLRFYDEVKKAYHKIFKRCGLEAIYTVAGGGEFTASNTHEFQVLASVGEDTIFVCSECGYAENSEISKMEKGGSCSECGKGEATEEKSIEVGNIFPLGTKYSEAFGLRYVNKEGDKNLVVMASYGIGLGRTMASVVEVSHDERGIIWPESIAPFKVIIVEILSGKDSDKKVVKFGEKLYNDLQARGVEVLYDDRKDKSAGEKFTEADLFGIPYRVVVSEKTVEVDKIELKKRNKKEAELVTSKELLKIL